MLIDFYAGDQRRIVEAWHRDEWDALAAPGIVNAHADLSFHLWPVALDELVLSACTITARPPMTFGESVHGGVPENAESGIHEMSDSFRDLFAAVPTELADQLFDRWMQRLPEPQAPAPEKKRQRRARAIRRGAERLVFRLVFFPIAAGCWLFSRRFREERRLNRARHEAAGKKVAPAAKYTLRDGVASLIDTCRTAKEQKKKVLYAWSL